MKKLLLLFASLSILAILASCYSGESGSDSDANAVAPSSIAGNTYALTALPLLTNKGSLPSASTIVFKTNTFTIKSTSGDGTSLTGTYIYVKNITENHIGVIKITKGSGTFKYGIITFYFKSSKEGGYAADFDEDNIDDGNYSHRQSGVFEQQS